MVLYTFKCCDLTNFWPFLNKKICQISFLQFAGKYCDLTIKQKLKIFFEFFFRHIIKRLSTVQNPAIYLRGVRHEDIKNILEFMYLGEVSVAQEDLDSFLSVAQDLCIKGLTQGDNNQSQPNPGPSQSSSRSSSSSVQGPPPKRLKMTKNNGETAKNIPKQEPKLEYKPEPEVIPEVCLHF